MDPAIEAVDFTMIKMKLMDADEGEGWTSEHADAVIAEYKKFLYLTKTFGSNVVPSKLVDTVWHYHILDTQAYAEDCQNVFGMFMHHYPYWGMRGEADLKSLNDAWASTLALYAKTFGCDAPYNLWLAAGRCPNCGSRSDARLKTNLMPTGRLVTTAAGAKLTEYSWDWTDHAANELGCARVPRIGVIAQEAQLVSPNAVTADQDGYLCVNYLAL